MKVLRALEYFCRGILFGICFHFIFIDKLNLSHSTKFFFGLSLIFTIGMGNCISKQFRCISILVIPSCFNKVGKTVIHAIIVTYLVSGPVNNIAENMNQIVKIVTCSSSLSYNYTKAKLDLMLRPFTAATLKIKPDLTEINDTLKSLDKIILPITDEMKYNNRERALPYDNDDDDDDVSKIEADKYEFQYINKVKNRCMTVLKNAQDKCNSHFVDAYRNCSSRMVLLGALFCWPIQLSVVCAITNFVGADSCDAKKHIDPGLGEEYSKLLKNSKKFKDDFQDVNLNYKMNNSYERFFSYDDMNDVAQVLKSIIMERKFFIEYILEILHIIFSILFLRVILSAQNYHNNFHKEINFDNKFINYYFIKIDRRRKLKKKLSLLPLNKIERKEIFYLNISILKNIRVINVVKNILKTVLNMIVPMTIILLDRLIYEALCVIKNHGEVQYYEEGSHKISVKVKGTGMMASLVKSMVKEFDQASNLSTIRSNIVCLPTPSEMPFSFLYIIFGCYFMMFLISISTLYTTLINRLICARFYPKREKCRTLYLYNKVLKERCILYKKYKKSNCETQSIYTRQNEYMSQLKNQFPKLTVYFKCMKLFLDKCVICDENEKISGKHLNLIQCQSCKLFYCSVCWEIIDEYCHVCRKKEK